MRRQRAIQALLISIAALIAFGTVAYLGSHVIGGLGKLFVFLALACLLMFVVARAEDISRVVKACLRILPAFLFALIPDQTSVWQPLKYGVVPNEPSPSPLFQRPPPNFSA